MRNKWAWTALFAATAALWAPVQGPAAATPYEIAMAPYEAQLRRQCPAKQLERLTPSALDFKIEDFRETLSVRNKRLMAKAHRRSCRHTFAGITCQNVGYIKEAHRLGLTPRLAASVCKSSPPCNDQICNPAW